MVSNGIGGYASSTILGLNTRPQHGLLVAALHPPAGRVVVLSKVEETLVLPGSRLGRPASRHELSTDYSGGAVHPEGYRALVEFRLDPWPTSFFRVGQTLLEKTVFMLPGENATVIGYSLHASAGPVQLLVRPLTALRPLQPARPAHPSVQPAAAADVEEAAGVVRILFSESLPPTLGRSRGQAWIEGLPGRNLVRLPELELHHNAETSERSPRWHPNLGYPEAPEKIQRDSCKKGVSFPRKRESDSVPAQAGIKSGTGSPVKPEDDSFARLVIREDLWSFGSFSFLLKVGETGFLVASTGRRGRGDFVFHRRRVENTQAVIAQTIRPPGEGPLAVRLGWTAESFAACGRKTIPGPRSRGERKAPALPEAYLLAGFPGGAPGGRDALIGLPGLLLRTQRIELARSVLLTLASHVKGGLIPVRFSEADGSPEYDSADASLWFFWAAWHYWRLTRDFSFVGKRLLGALQEVMEGYLEGTEFGIGMDDDGLIRLSDPGGALTWMDARLPGESGPAVTGWPAVTPRAGKPVEVNALWYCALGVMGAISEEMGLKRAKSYLRMSRMVQQSFTQAFLSPDGLVYDRLTDAGPDPSIRPNALIAASLPFSPLSREESRKVLETVERELLTPAGIRTLSPRHPDYRGRCDGDLQSRARAAHQGTIWPWLIGPYAAAVCRVRGRTRATQEILARQIKPILKQLEQGALGSVAEIFDGDPPHAPRGMASQAASVGEVLRAIADARLSDL